MVGREDAGKMMNEVIDEAQDEQNLIVQVDEVHKSGVACTWDNALANIRLSVEVDVDSLSG